MPFVGETNRDTVFVERPQLLDQPVVQLAGPFATKEGDYLLPTDDKLRTIAPPALPAVAERHSFRLARIPGIFCQPHLRGRALKREGWDRRPTIFSLHGLPSRLGIVWSVSCCSSSRLQEIGSRAGLSQSTREQGTDDWRGRPEKKLE